MADVNAKPVEVVGTTEMLGCSTDSTQLLTNPTCGSLYYNSKRVTCSEGFCCPCTLDQMLGLGSHQRGELQCNLLTSLFSNGASVHCLRWGPMWYSVFKMVTPMIDSQISVYTSMTNKTNVNLSLTPSAPVASSVGIVNMTARLVGSFEWTRAPTDWGLSNYAVTPNLASSTGPLNDDRIRKASITDPFKFGMLVAQSATDLTGFTCNKIGVSHSAFVNNQGSRCSGHIGDCLYNQLDDIWKSNSPNTIVDNLCASIGGSFVHNDGYRLSCQLSNSSGDSPTQVLIQLNAQNVSIVVNQAIGIIVAVTMSNPLISALTQTIWANIQIANTGTLPSAFGIAVSACIPSLTLPLSASQISLVVNQTTVVSVKLEDSNMTGNTYNCTAALTDSDNGGVLSQMAFQFNISSVATDRGAQASDGTSGDGNNTITAAPIVIQPDPCSTACSGFFSVICFATNACWTKLATLVGTIGGTSLILFLLNKFGVFSTIWTALKSVCCNSKTPKRRNSETSSVPYQNQQDYNMYPPPPYTYTPQPYKYPPPQYNPYSVQY